jgi:uncharacterized membrane protein
MAAELSPERHVPWGMSPSSQLQSTATQSAEPDQNDVGLMRMLRRKRRAKSAISPDDCSVGQRVADSVAGLMGSWHFIIAQSVVLLVWVILNTIGWMRAWDPYPFILMNLALSFQAAYAAPLIMMSQNRQAEIDRRNAAHDFEVNLKAEHEIKALHAKINLLHEELERVRAQDLAELTRLVRAMNEKVAPAERAEPPPRA